MNGAPASRAHRAAGAVSLAAVLALAGCAGTVAKKPQPSATNSTPAAGASTAASRAAPATPASETANRPLSVAVLDSSDYGAGRERREQALLKRIGADALTPDDVGYYMEVQEAELRRRLSDATTPRIAKQGRGIVIGPIARAFSSNSSLVGAQLRGTLDAVAPVIREFAKTLVIVHAYTDRSGPARYNRKLSMRRALAVARYLEKTGVSGARILAVGHGEAGGDVPDQSAKGRAADRRITIELDPLAEGSRNHGGGH